MEESLIQEKYGDLLLKRAQARVEWVSALETEMKIYKSLCAGDGMDVETQTLFKESIKSIVVAASSLVPTYADFKSDLILRKIHPIAKPSKQSKSVVLTDPTKQTRLIRKPNFYVQQSNFMSGVVNTARIIYAQSLTRTEEEWWAMFETFVLISGKLSPDLITITPLRFANYMRSLDGVDVVFGPNTSEEDARQPPQKKVLVDVAVVKQHLLSKAQYSKEPLIDKLLEQVEPAFGAPSTSVEA